MIRVSNKTLGFAGAALASLVLVTQLVGWNEAGKRQVVQTASGSVSCVFEPGPYMEWFGTSHEYPDVVSYDFDKDENSDSTLEYPGIGVRYRDGGLGTVFGIARYSLPGDCPTMMKIHKEFRSANGLATKILKPYTDEVANQTAGLMTSEESYAEKRGTFTDWFRTQLNQGRYKTRMEEKITTEPGKEFCLDEELMTEELREECASVKKTRERIPVIDDRTPDLHLKSDIKQYGLVLTGFQLQAPDYEPKTLKQIADKREATMGVITANANAERAKAEAVEAEQKGIKDVVTAKYAAEKIAAKEIVDAEKRVELAAQQKLEAKEKALAAEHYKAEQILKGEGDAERKRLVMEADGALQQKLEAWVTVNEKYASAIAKQKWVPEVQMGSGEGATTGGAANDLVQLMTVSTAKQLGLDVSIPEGKKRK